jgi:protein-disulfide isomerase
MAQSGKVIERAADLVLIVVALTMLGFYIARRPTSRSASEAPTVAPENWRSENTTGIGMGPLDAPVIVMEFMDFECPFCAAWAARVDSLVQEFPDKVRVVLHHFPLTGIHPQAMQAAIAAECADRQGAFPAFQRIVFGQQSVLGIKPWIDFAAEANVMDIAGYAHCLSSPADSFPRIAHGIRLARMTGVRGTPTVWVNGLVARPTLDEFRAMLVK